MDMSIEEMVKQTEGIITNKGNEEIASCKAEIVKILKDVSNDNSFMIQCVKDFKICKDSKYPPFSRAAYNLFETTFGKVHSPCIEDDVCFIDNHGNTGIEFRDNRFVWNYCGEIFQIDFDDIHKHITYDMSTKTCVVSFVYNENMRFVNVREIINSYRQFINLFKESYCALTKEVQKILEEEQLNNL